MLGQRPLVLLWIVALVTIFKNQAITGSVAAASSHGEGFGTNMQTQPSSHSLPHRHHLHHPHLHNHNGNNHSHPFRIHANLDKHNLTNPTQSCSYYRYNVTDFQDIDSLSPLKARKKPNNGGFDVDDSLYYRGICYFPYEIVPGYVPTELGGSLYPNTTAAVQATNDAQIKYYCNDTTTSFYFNNHIRNKITGRTLNSKHLLTLLKNKSLVLFGDSTARQLLVDLQVEFLPYHTKVIDYDWKMNVYEDAAITRSEHAGMFFGMSRYYRDFNATIFYCQNSRMGGVDSRESMFACNNLLRTGDYIVIAAGAWFRPHDGTDTDGPNYDEALLRRSKIYQEKIMSVRKLLAAINPKVKVIWRLVPHAGKFEEIYYVDGKLRQPNDYGRYSDWLVWDDVGLTGKWSLLLNHVILDFVSTEFPQDRILDAFTTSLMYIDYSRPRGYVVHADAVHYCPGGAMRASMLLLEEIIEELSSG